jgi:hypothetical protein
MTDLDRLIDDVAREMTEAPAAAELRQRVVDEAIAPFRDEAKASYHDLTKWTWLAAAAAVVIAAYLQFGSRVEPQRHAQPSSTQASREAPPAVPGKIVLPERPAVAAVRSTPARRQTRPSPAERSTASTIAALPTLTGPAALAIGPLDSSAHGVPALGGLASLDVDRLDIKPLALPH